MDSDFLAMIGITLGLFLPTQYGVLTYARKHGSSPRLRIYAVALGFFASMILASNVTLNRWMWDSVLDLVGLVLFELAVGLATIVLYDACWSSLCFIWRKARGARIG